MGRTRLPVLHRPTPLVSEPANGSLPPRPAHFRAQSAATAGAGLMLAGLLDLQSQPALAPLTATLALAAAVWVWRSGATLAVRQRMQDLLVEALAAATANRKLDRGVVKLTHWAGRGVGIPQQVTIRYAPGVPDGDPNWRASIIDVLQRRIGLNYQVTHHDRRTCRLILEPDRTQPPATLPLSHQRAEKAITHLIGPTTTITDIETGDTADDILRIHVTHEEPTKCAVAGFRLRSERTISSILPGRWRALWNLEADHVTFERRAEMPASIWLPETPPLTPDEAEQLLENYRKVAIPIGVDEDARIITWAPGIAPHLLITGGTGSGKTATIHGIIGNITRCGWPVWVVDGKRVEFLDHRSWPGIQIVANAIEHQVAVIHQAWQLMENRYQLIEHGKVRINDLEPLVLVLDEYSDFVANLLDWYAKIKIKGDPTKPRTLQEVGSLLRKGRTARVHVIASMQRPDVILFGAGGGETRSNFVQRISLGRLDPAGAQMMWGDAYTGVTIPRNRTGRGMAVNDAGRPVETQCYRFPDMTAEPGTDQHTLLQKLRPADARHPRLVIVPPEEDRENLDLDTGDPHLTFDSYLDAAWALADARPDLDPITNSPDGEQITPERARALSSPLASLGLHPDVEPRRRRLAPGLFVVAGGDPGEVEGDSFEGEADRYAGYGDPITLSPAALEIGDLLEVDAGSGVWMVVDETPEEDPMDPSCYAVSWRSDDDEGGVCTLPADDPIQVRRVRTD